LFLGVDDADDSCTGVLAEPEQGYRRGFPGGLREGDDRAVGVDDGQGVAERVAADEVDDEVVGAGGFVEDGSGEPVEGREAFGARGS
jgi:hypothetical protein